MSDQPIFDVAAAMDRVDNDKELLFELVQMMEDQYPMQIAEIESAVQNNNAALLGSSAHAIKSALGNLGAMRCYELAFALEKAGKTNSLSSAKTVLNDLKAQFSLFLDEVKKNK